ncbi:hypothetical protein ACTFIV_003876 [Dictyostelium citrinum]
MNNTSIVFHFCGQAVLGKNVALELYNEKKTFRESMDRIDNYLKINYFNGESMLNKLRNLNLGECESSDQYLSHSVLFMFQVSLFELFKSECITPSFICGISCGEMASLYCSGALSLKSVCDLLVERARLMEIVSKNCPNGIPFFGTIGGEEFKEKYLKKYPDVEIGGRFSNFSSLLGTNNSEQFDQISKEFDEKGIKIKRFLSHIPFHTSSMDLCKEEALKIKDIDFNDFSTIIPIYNSSNGKIYDEENRFNIFKSIRNCLCTQISMEDIFRTLESNGKKKVIFVELSPHPIITPMVFEIVKTLNSQIFTTTSEFENNPNVISLSSLNKNNNDVIHFNNIIEKIKIHLN